MSVYLCVLVFVCRYVSECVCICVSTCVPVLFSLTNPNDKTPQAIQYSVVIQIVRNHWTERHSNCIACAIATLVFVFCCLFRETNVICNCMYLFIVREWSCFLFFSSLSFLPLLIFWLSLSSFWAIVAFYFIYAHKNDKIKVLSFWGSTVDVNYYCICAYVGCVISNEKKYCNGHSLYKWK